MAKSNEKTPVISYQIILERQNGTEIVLLDKDRKVGIAEFFKIAKEQSKKKTTKHIYTLRYVDGVEDGNGVIMRHIIRKDGEHTIALPKGLYHKLDCEVDPSTLKPIKIKLDEDEF